MHKAERRKLRSILKNHWRLCTLSLLGSKEIKAISNLAKVIKTVGSFQKICFDEFKGYLEKIGASKV